MALTREMLKGMNLTEEQVSAIIGEHVSVKNGLEEKIKQYKADAEQLAAVQKELDDLKKSGGNWEEKYTKEHADFEQYKADVAAKEVLVKKREAYSALLKENKIGDKYIDSILNVAKYSDMELDENGKLKDADKISESIKSDYSGFVINTETKGAGTETPPGDNSAMTKEAFEKLPLSERMSYANAHPSEVSEFLK